MNVPESLKSLRVALVHDFLNQQGGAENVVEVLVEMFPGAPIYTSVYDAKRMPASWKLPDIRTSFMQHLSPRLRTAKALLPLYPTAFELFDLSEYDLVLSSTTAFAKGVITRPDTCHICYCHNPTRFLWMYHEYVEYERLPLGSRAILPLVATPLRVWDQAAAQRVDYFVAGSFNAQRRIRKYYRRESDVIQPPVDTSLFQPAKDVGDFFLVASRLQPYKRIDLAVDACTRLGLPLHVVGDGPDRTRLQERAGPTVRFLGRVPAEEVRRQMAHCRAFILPGEEDFGLTPLEVQASGRPVIAYGAGGALETVKDGETGEFFTEQTVAALAGTLARFEDHFDPCVVRAHAQAFDVAGFKERFYALIARRYAEHKAQA
ncbi:MAG: glycosyltransferase [Chloroflexota bacterium]|nr:glycosyltransferase [Chloroflexota bacterium]